MSSFILEASTKPGQAQFEVKEYPTNLRSQGLATALFSRLTFSRRRLHRNASRDAITRSPAARDLTNHVTVVSITDVPVASALQLLVQIVEQDIANTTV